MNYIKILITIVGITTLFSGCGPKFERLNDIQLESKNYESSDKIGDLAFAIARPEILIKNKVSRDTSSALSKRLEHNGNLVACHLQSELKKLLVGKGITVNDTFKNRDEMTFTQKRDTSALFYPEITIEILEDSMTVYDIETRASLSTAGHLTAKAKVNIVMLEPLSGEKIWIRSLPVKSETVPLQYAGFLLYSGSPNMVHDKVKHVALSFDKLFVNIDKNIMESADKYIDIEEFKFLNTDIQKLKDIKRY